MTRLDQAKRIVVKIGSILLVDPETGKVHKKWLAGLAEDIARLRARGQEVILVSSGAIALGRRHLGLRAGKLKLEEKPGRGSQRADPPCDCLPGCDVENTGSRLRKSY